MFLTIGMVLVALWLVGVIGFHVVGWYIHVLLVVAIIIILTRVIKGR